MCGRTFCKWCNQEMIHRDQRKSYEASSAFNQILHREGPAHLAAGDIDTYAEKWKGSAALLRLIEHKQPNQPVGKAQERVLRDLDKLIAHATEHPVPGVNLLDGSGVFIMRGLLQAEEEGRKKVDFASPQTIERLDGSVVLEPRNRNELWDWLNGGGGWTPRRARGRWWG